MARIYQFFKPEAPRFHDAEFYKDRDVADHINQPGHRERLFRTLADVEYVLNIDPESKTVVDLGCGNGGFLHELTKRHPYMDCKGYDLSPKAVQYGKDEYGLNLKCLDFVNEDAEFGDVITLTEVLEHLVEPFDFLDKLRGKSRWIVASVPAFETPEQHYEYHLWAFEPAAFAQTFLNKGYEVLTHYIVPMCGTQFIIARNK